MLHGIHFPCKYIMHVLLNSSKFKNNEASVINNVAHIISSIEMQLFMKSCDFNVYLIGSRLPKHPSCHVYSTCHRFKGHVCGKE